MFERVDDAVTNPAPTAGDGSEQTEVEQKQHSATHSFPTFPVYNRGIRGGPSVACGTPSRPPEDAARAGKPVRAAQTVNAACIDCARHGP